MKSESLKRGIEKRGGKVTVHNSSYNPRLEGELNGHDIEMIDGQSSFFTVRAISDRGHCDQGSDYNPGGYTFCRKIKDLDWATK